MNSESIRIPLDRIGALIGTRGETKKAIEKKAKAKLEIDSETGEVEIDGVKDAVLLLKTVTVVKAIGRGFSPEKAFKLFEEEFLLDVIDLTQDLSSKKELENIRARVIGTQGKARRKIEEESHSFISVYGKTVSIIAKVNDMHNAHRAVEMLLKGASHSRVYNVLKDHSEEKFEL